MLIWRHGWNLNAALSFERLDVIKLKYLFATSWFINLCNNGHLQGGVYWFKIFPFQPFRCLLAVKAFFFLHFYLTIFILLWFFFLFVFLKICNYIFFWFVPRDAEMWWIMNIIFAMEWWQFEIKRGDFNFFIFRF